MKTPEIKPLIAIIIILCSFSYFFMITLFNVKANDQVVIAIVGSLGTVLGYFFGSSSQSAKKDETINNLTENQ